VDLFTRLLLRAAIWVRRPPSRRMILTVAIAIGAALLIAALEWAFGWPDWLTVSPHGFRRPSPVRL
jgi:hypothetical protein